MGLEEFALGESIVHRLDPRTKLLTALLFSTVVALNYSIAGSLIAGVFPVVMVGLTGIGWAKILRRMVIVNSFIAMIWMFLPFTVPGETIWSLGPLTVQWEGLVFALLITIKSNVILLTVITLLGTTPVFDLVHALSHMGVPERLIHVFFFCFRYVHVIHDEYLRLLKAMKIRGFRPATNLHTYRSYAYLVGMLLVKSFDRSQKILAAMKCRGFQGKFYILHHYNMRRSDYALAACSVAFAAIVLVIPL
ncbi:MAG: cobalt ECF transporter T component CbiQ [Thermodesulfobacteriota bacterium]